MKQEQVLSDEETAAVELAINARLDKLPPSMRGEVLRAVGYPPDVSKISDQLRDDVETELQDSIRRRLDTKFKNVVEKLGRKQKKEIREMGGEVPARWWDETRKEMEEAVFLFLVSAYGLSANWHGVPQAHAEIDAQKYARKQARRVSQTWTDTTRRKLGEFLGKAAKDFTAVQLDPNPDAATAQRVEDNQSGRGLRDHLDKTITSERADAMATTEVTMAVTLAGESFSKTETNGDRNSDRWYTMLDDRVCPVCEPLHGVTRSVWGIDFPNGPPAHPRCRCRIQYDKKGARGGLSGRSLFDFGGGQ